MNSRNTSLKILMDINLKGAYSNYAINKHLKGEMDIKDENLARELVYGVLEHRLYLDYIISKLSKVKIKKIQPAILEILRIGVYQIVFMERIPDRAAINEAVNLSKQYGYKGASGFVNGVLRNFLRNKDKLMKIDEKEPSTYISIKYSHPKWMVKKWIDEYGYEFTEKLCMSNNCKPKLNIRINRLKTSREELIKNLSKYGYNLYRTKYSKDGILVDNPTRITELEEFKLGYFTIQDESSMLVSQIADPREGSLVLDLCSAPGGKSTHMGELMGNKGKIISRDIYVHKLELVRENYSRLGIDIISTEIFNALVLDESMVGKADYCIVDVPCSGLGIIRRKPDIKWKREEKDIKELRDIQIKILNNAKYYIKPGGIIIYSTCTIGREENLNIVREFLDENRKFRLLGFENLLEDIKNLDTAKDGYIQLFPHVHNTDGFFIAKIQKKNE